MMFAPENDTRAIFYYNGTTPSYNLEDSLRPKGDASPSQIADIVSRFMEDNPVINGNNSAAGSGHSFYVNVSVTSFISSTMAANLLQSTSHHVFGDVLFAYTSPFLIFLGLVGNLLSLFVFLFGARSSKVTRSQYLLCLGVSDSVVLLSYVLPEWVKRGITTLDPTAKYLSSTVYDSWRCYTILFLSYSSRFISAWLRVVFTFERFYSIRFPFKRLTFANRVTRIFICLTVLSGLLISSLKPPLMQSRLNLELNTASTAEYTTDYTTDTIYDMSSLFTSSFPPHKTFDLGPTPALSSRSLSQIMSDNGDDFNTFLPGETTSGYGDHDLFMTRSHTQSEPLLLTTNDPADEISRQLMTTTQVDPRMLEALLHVFGGGNAGGAKGNTAGMNTSEFIDVMLGGEATPNPVCVVRPEYRKYGELYDTLYFGVFIMLLPFLFIIIFDFNVLYVVRHREGQLLSTNSGGSNPNAAASALAVNTRKANVTIAGNFHWHPQLQQDNRSRGIISAVAGGSSLVPDKLTVMLVLSSCFILLNLPYFIVWSIYSYFIQPGQTTQAKAKFTDVPTDIFNNLSFAARTISGLTYSVNGVIYFVSDRAFRADFVGLLKKCCSCRRNGFGAGNRLKISHSNVMASNVNQTVMTTRGGVARLPSNASKNSGHRSLSPSQSYNNNKTLFPAHQPSQTSNNNKEQLPDIVRDHQQQNGAAISNGGPDSLMRKNGSLRRKMPATVEECAPLVPTSPVGHQALTCQRSVHFADDKAAKKRSISPSKEMTAEIINNNNTLGEKLSTKDGEGHSRRPLIASSSDGDLIRSSDEAKGLRDGNGMKKSASTMVIYCDLESNC